MGSGSQELSASRSLAPHASNASRALDVPRDAEELGRLLEEFRSYLLAIANAEFPRALAAKLGPSDLVQLTLAKGHVEFHDFRGKSREELASWLRMILLNHLNSEVRAYAREKRDVRREVQADGRLAHPFQLSPSREALSREERKRLDAALARLPESYRKAIELRHREDLSFQELGRQLNRSEEAARKLWTRAIRQLQQELGIDGKR